MRELRGNEFVQFILQLRAGCVVLSSPNCVCLISVKKIKKMCFVNSKCSWLVLYGLWIHPSYYVVYKLFLVSAGLVGRESRGLLIVWTCFRHLRLVSRDSPA